MQEWSPFLQILGDALVNCIPPEWETVVLFVEQAPLEGSRKFYHPQIKGPPGQKEMIFPSSLVLLAIQKLGDYLEVQGIKWNSFLFSLYLDHTLFWQLQFLIQ